VRYASLVARARACRTHTSVAGAATRFAAGIKLQQAGIPFRIFEKADDLGGTWYVNKYPGVACDVPAHGYSYSFELNPDWSTAFAPGEEIEQYIRGVARKHDIYKACTFGTEVLSAAFDQAAHMWRLTYSTKGGPVESTQARVLIMCVGGLHVPSFPPAPGVCDGTFKGIEVHSAAWNIDTVNDLKGKNVVVVGSAASAVQIVPEICDHVKSLTVVQRTPNWLAPQHGPQVPVSLVYGPWARWALARIPGLLRLYRIVVYWSMEMLHFPLQLFSNTSVGHAIATRVLRKYMSVLLRGNKELEAKVIPTYTLGCKRIIRSEKFLPALLKPNVHLVTAGLTRVESDGLVMSNGEKIKSDVCIYATGFQVGSVGPLKIEGLGGHVVQGSGLMDGRGSAYLGITSPLFPNAFMMLGPNTGLGHNSIIIMIEAQVEYAVKVISLMADENVAEIVVKQEKVDEFMAEVDAGFAGSVWTAPGCISWYQNKEGKVPTLWPFSTVRYMREAAPPSDLRAYKCVKAGGEPRGSSSNL
jgi:cation diffusion facilitator CzcD-associated flavoprotein CzcO